MAEHIITVFATHTRPIPLTISDDEGHFANTHAGDAALTTDVLPGDTITWKFTGDIQSIDGIVYKNETNSVNLFSTQPAKNADGSWSGIIGENVPNLATEKYDIHYTLNGVKYIEDPKLKAHPST